MPTCLSCNNTLSRYFAAGECLCPDYFFDNGVAEECYSCDITCVTCSDSLSTSCLSCDPSMFRELSLSGECVCTDGYYQVNTFTVLCDDCYYTC